MPNSGTAPAITIRLTLFADLRRFLPAGQEGPLMLDLPAGAIVADLIAAANLPGDEAMTIGVNGEQGARETVLNDGDEVVFFSPMEGG